MRSTRRALVIGTGLSALVALPALFARPWADERFVMYMPEELVGGNPLLLWDQVMREVTAFIDVGVFRPLSRLAFYLEHWLVVRIGINTGVAPNVVMAVVKLAMVALLLSTAVMTLRHYRDVADSNPRTWDRVTVLLPVVFAGSLVLVNPAVHPVTLFPGLYLGTAAIALLTPLMVGRAFVSGEEPVGRRRLVLYGAAALLGAVLASMIELAWLGVPLALVHLMLLSVQRTGWGSLGELRHEFATRLWVVLAAGFAVVFLPARGFIAYYCSSGGCYDAASPSLGGKFLAVLPYRIGSAFAPVGLLAQVRGVFRLMTRPSTALAISIVVSLIAIALLALSWRGLHAKREGRVGLRAALKTATPAAIYYVVVLLLASIISAISSGLQAKGLNPAPWRETGFGWIAWAVLLALLLAVVAERFDSRLWLGVGLLLFGLTFIATTVINREDMRRVGEDAEGMLHITAGRQLVDFDPSANAARCATIEGLREVAVNDSELRKLDLVAIYLDAAARNNYGRVFCDPGSS